MTLRVSLAALCGWLCVLSNVERLHEPLNVASFVYVYVAVVAVSIALVPMLSRCSALTIAVVLLAALVGLKAAFGRDIVGPHLPLTVTEAVGVLITWALARQVSLRLSGLEEAAVGALVPPSSRAVVPFDSGQEQIYREVHRARRFDRPLSIIALAPSATHGPVAERIVEHLRRRLAAEFVYARMLDELARRTSPCDLITRRNGHLVVLLPEVDGAAADVLAEDLRRSLSGALDMEVYAGRASFPDEEITLAGLLERAEARMWNGSVVSRPAASSGSAAVVGPQSPPDSQIAVDTDAGRDTVEASDDETLVL
ncbi:MAG: hypothetical protein KY476_14240 [Planctomycetes bacterium]|nr:hypothetical protein [Planctomycetota bacterium]